MKNTLVTEWFRARRIIKLLGNLEKTVNNPKFETELVKLNKLRDDQFEELRFIADYLRDYAAKLDHIRNYGKSR